MRYLSIAALAVLLLTLPTLALPDEPDTENASFNGAWIKNVELSDDPKEAMGPARNAPPGQGGMKSGAMGRGGGRRGGGMGKGGARATTGRANPGGKVERVTPFPGQARLRIFHEQEEFSITNAQDIVQTVYLDGRRTERWTARGQMIESARMSNGCVIVRGENDLGLAIEKTYCLTDEGRRLTVLHRFKPQGRDDMISMKVVYDRSH